MLYIKIFLKNRAPSLSVMCDDPEESALRCINGVAVVEEGLYNLSEKEILNSPNSQEIS